MEAENHKKGYMFMLNTLFRTALIYLLLTITIRLMGKRQLGELDICEFVITILLSEVAAAPITNSEIPLTRTAVAIIALVLLEILSSYLLIKIPKAKKLLSSRPSVIISRGVLDISAMRKVRMSIEELICQIRQNGIFDIDEVDYAILEENGKMSIIPKSKYRQPDRSDLSIPDNDSGMMHIIISDGTVNKDNLKRLGLNEKWLSKTLRKHTIKTNEVFCMTCNDARAVYIIKKDGTAIRPIS